MNNILKSWKTTVLGAASLIISALVAFGVFSPEDSVGANQIIVSMVENIGSLITAIVGIIAMFTRDNDVSSETAGAK